MELPNPLQAIKVNGSELATGLAPSLNRERSCTLMLFGARQRPNLHVTCTHLHVFSLPLKRPTSARSFQLKSEKKACLEVSPDT